MACFKIILFPFSFFRAKIGQTFLIYEKTKKIERISGRVLQNLIELKQQPTDFLHFN